jgi:hypothetical protein
VAPLRYKCHLDVRETLPRIQKHPQLPHDYQSNDALGGSPLGALSHAIQ